MTITVNERPTPYAVMEDTQGRRLEVRGAFNINFRLGNKWTIVRLEGTQAHIDLIDLPKSPKKKAK